MKGIAYAAGALAGRSAAARLVDGQLDDLLLDPLPGAAAPGAIFRAIAGRPAGGTGGQFVQLSGATGFLRGGAAPQGQALTVQVVAHAEPGKAAPVSQRLALKGRFVIVTPGAPGLNASRRFPDDARRAALIELLEAEELGGNGVILRSGAQHAPDDDIVADLRAQLARAGDVAAHRDGTPALLAPAPTARAQLMQDWADPPPTMGTFEAHGVPDLIDAMAGPEVALSTGSAWIEPTRALVAIDVNTGAAFGPRAGLKANLALAAALPRHLRCRGLGGQILLDPAPMRKSDREALERAIKRAFLTDPVRTELAGWTPLGLLELKRQRARPAVDLGALSDL